MTNKLNKELVTRQILSSLVKSLPLVGSGLHELLFGTVQKIENQETQKLLMFTLEQLDDEIKKLSNKTITQETLNSTIEKIIQNQFLSFKNLLDTIINSSNDIEIIPEFKNIYFSLDKYLNHLKEETDKIHFFDWNIYTLPITILPYNINFEGIKTIIDVDDRKILLHGPPACGKSTAIKRILNTAIIQRKLIPIELSDQDIYSPTKVEERTCGKLSVQSKKIFSSLENEGRFLFIFDGLNEYNDIRILARNYNTLSETFLNSKFLITCRTHEFKNDAESELDGFIQYHIKGLSWENQKNCINNTISDPGKREKLLDIFSKEPILRKVCSNQFIFLMAIDYIPKEKIPPRISSEFYELFLRRFLKNWEKKSLLKNSSVEAKRNILEDIAYTITCSKTSKTSMDETDLEKNISILAETGETKLLFEELYKHGLIVKKNNYVRFFQETFQEFLIASWLKRKGIFPKDMIRNRKGLWEYKDLKISQLSERFYLELSGILDYCEQKK